MEKKDQREAFDNRAIIRGADNHTDCTACPDCPEYLVFALQDKTHTFSLGLFTVLECLKIAEQEGYVPPLPLTWWWDVREK